MKCGEAQGVVRVTGSVPRGGAELFLSIYMSSSSPSSIVFINDVLKSSRASSSVRTGLHADCCRACLCARLAVCLRCAGSREGINLAL